MSAFYVGTDHINAMLLIYGPGQTVTTPDGLEKPGNEENLTAIGAALLMQNIEALKIRYPAAWPQLCDESDIAKFRFEFDLNFQRLAKPGDYAKLIRCYRYQCSEDPEFESNYAGMICRDMESRILERLPVSDDDSPCSAWGYERPQDWPIAQARIPA